MRLKWIAATLVLAFALPAGAQPASGEEDVQKVRQAYLKAKKLYKGKDYSKAIRAFSEVRKMKYHPILDYRIGLCYEALKQYKKAKAFFKVYVKYYDKGFPVGKNHPTTAAVKKRMKNLDDAKTPPVTPAPAVAVGNVQPTEPTTPPTRPTRPTARASQAQYAPYTDAPPPGYENAPPPPPPPAYGPGRRVPRRFARWASLYITGDFGAAGLSGDTEDAGYDEGGAGAWAGIFYRPSAFVSGGVIFGGHAYRPKSELESAGAGDLGQIFTGLEVRGHLPLMGYTWRPWSLELWGGLSGGFAYAMADTEVMGQTSENTLQGGFIGASVGADLYLTRWLSIGALVRVVKPFWNKACVDDDCVDKDELEDAGGEMPDDVAIYGGFSATLHLYIL